MAPPHMFDDADRHGFDWPAGGEDGARVQVMRMTSVRGRRVLRVATEHVEIEIAISPSGHEISVYGVDVKMVASA